MTYPLREALDSIGAAIRDEHKPQSTAIALHYARRLAQSMTANHCPDTATMKTWGEALIVAAASIGAIDPASDSLKLAINVQAFAGWLLYTKADPSSLFPKGRSIIVETTPRRGARAARPVQAQGTVSRGISP